MPTKTDDEFKLQFGKRLRAIRTAQGFSQEQLALASGLDRSYIGGVERGQRNISVVNICTLARTLSVSPKDFFE